MNTLERRKMSVYRCAVADIIDELQGREGFDFDGIDEDINEEIKDALEGIIESHFGEYLEYRILRRLSEREPAVITEAADEIERLRAALQLIAADVTGNKWHQAQFRQDTACEALEAKDDVLRNTKRNMDNSSDSS
jgi:hypothetical protein